MLALKKNNYINIYYVLPILSILLYIVTWIIFYRVEKIHQGYSSLNQENIRLIVLSPTFRNDFYKHAKIINVIYFPLNFIWINLPIDRERVVIDDIEYDYQGNRL